MHQHPATVASHFAGNGVQLADLVTPIVLPYRNDGQLGQDDDPTDGSSHLLGALHTQADVSIIVSSGNKGLDPGLLAGAGLLLHRPELQDLVLESRAQEEVNDL